MDCKNIFSFFFSFKDLVRKRWIAKFLPCVWGCVVNLEAIIGWCCRVFRASYTKTLAKRWIPGRAVVQLHHCLKTCSGKYMCPYLQLEASLQAKNLFGDIIRNSIKGVFPYRHQILGKHLELTYQYLLFLSPVLCFDPSQQAKRCKKFSRLYHSQTGSSPGKALHHQWRCLSQQLRDG